MIRLRFLLVFLVASACTEDHSTECKRSTECVQGGEPGECLTSTESDKHFCAYPDESCGSGLRWGVLAGDDLATECVLEASIDAGTPDGRPDGSGIDAALIDASPIDAEVVDAPPLDAAVIDATPPPMPIDATPPPDAFMCTPNEFEACLPGGILERCNATGTAPIQETCGAPGCNATAKRCNECVPSSATCSGSVLNTCGSDGLDLPDEACQLSCVAGAGGVKAHCAYLVPKYVPSACDAKATAAELVISTTSTFSTDVDANCNGGVVPQADGPSICAVRYGKFRIDASRTWTVTGSRVLAVVTDGLLEVKGTLDVGAKGSVSGPGGGTQVEANVTAGASFAQKGGSSESVESGATINPLELTVIRGGPASHNSGNSAGAGGGGAATLVSCRGSVSVSGSVRSGGGGGGGAFVIPGNPFPQFVLARGGGAGGFVVIQGLSVAVTGTVFANGGGGGAGASNATMGTGADGTASASQSAPGGVSPDGTQGNGGAGGRKGVLPASATAGGAGGGSHGYFRALLPAGITPILSPSQASPSFSASGVVSTK